MNPETPSSMLHVPCPLKHIYIHIPFCSGKCIYCGFYSELYETEKVDKYLDNLEQEIIKASETYSILPETLYMGGGTPSLLSTTQLNKLFDIIKKNIDINNVYEWTLEGNPATFTTDKISLLKKYGVNRISLGAQSMNNSILSDMERRHTAEDTKQTVHKLKASGFDNIGIDLIACLPGVTQEMWQHTLNEAIRLPLNHISIYALSIDPNSKLHQMQHNTTHANKMEPGCPHPEQQSSCSVGRTRPKQGSSAIATRTKQPPQSPINQSTNQPSPIAPTHEQEQQALTTAETKLTAAGYNHYEVSNYAKPNHQCWHNTAIWQGADYLGFGPSASSRVSLQRWTNPRSGARDQRSEVGGTKLEIETLAPETDAAERFMFTFRLYDGVNPCTFAATHGSAAKALLPYWLKQLATLEQEGLAHCQTATWSLTKKGRNYADTVAERMLQ